MGPRASNLLTLQSGSTKPYSERVADDTLRGVDRAASPVLGTTGTGGGRNGTQISGMVEAALNAMITVGDDGRIAFI
jgi:hypothetical protein